MPLTNIFSPNREMMFKCMSSRRYFFEASLTRLDMISKLVFRLPIPLVLRCVKRIVLKFETIGLG